MRAADRLARLFAGPRLVTAAEGYALWAPRYPARPHNPVMEMEAAIVRPLVHAAAPRRALDVGTGTGRNLELLKTAGASFVAGVDVSTSMLSRADGCCPRVCGDALCLPFRSATFDTVCSSLMCGDIRDLRTWVHEAARVLAPAGHLIYSDFHPSWLLMGWRRTFVGENGCTYELPLWTHQVEEHYDLLIDEGLEVRAVREPVLRRGDTPVVVVLHAVKPHAGSRA